MYYAMVFTVIVPNFANKRNQHGETTTTKDHYLSKKPLNFVVANFVLSVSVAINVNLSTR
jgi:hypothetical protein